MYFRACGGGRTLIEIRQWCVLLARIYLIVISVKPDLSRLVYVFKAPFIAYVNDHESHRVCRWDRVCMASLINRVVLALALDQEARKRVA